MVAFAFILALLIASQSCAYHNCLTSQQAMKAAPGENPETSLRSPVNNQKTTRMWPFGYSMALAVRIESLVATHRDVRTFPRYGCHVDIIVPSKDLATSLYDSLVIVTSRYNL